MIRGVLLLALIMPAAVMKGQSLPVVDEDGNFRQRDDRPIGVLRVRAQCGEGRDLSRSRILDQEAKESETLRKSDRAPAAWYALGCSRALLFAAGGRAREGLLMPPSTSWANGAVSALLRGLAIDSLHAPSLELLAALGLETAPNEGYSLSPAMGQTRTHPDRIADPARFAKVLVRAALEPEFQPSPLVLRACVSLSLHLERIDHREAARCADRALRFGHDSTWHLLRLAYIAFRGLDLPLGDHFFEAAATAAHEPIDRAEIGWHLYGRAPGWFGEVRLMQPWQRMARSEWEGVLTMPDSAFLPWVRSRNAVLGRTLAMGPDRLAHHFHAIIHHASGFRNCASIDGDRVASGKPCGALTVFNLTRRKLAPNATAYRLFSPATGDRVVVVPLVVRGNEVTHTDSANTLLAELALWEAASNRWRNAQMQFAVTPGRDRTVIGAVLSAPDSGGTLAWQLSVRDQLRGKAGSVAGESADFTRGPVGLSDLVLGAPANALRWELDGRLLLLSPSLRFEREEPVELYFQLWADAPPREVRVALALYGTRAQDTVPRLRLDFPHRITQRFAEIERELDLSRLDKGDYRLELTVRGEEGSVLASRATRITVE